MWHLLHRVAAKAGEGYRYLIGCLLLLLEHLKIRTQVARNESAKFNIDGSDLLMKF